MIRLFQRGKKQNIIDTARHVSDGWRFGVVHAQQSLRLTDVGRRQLEAAAEERGSVMQKQEITCRGLQS